MCYLIQGFDPMLCLVNACMWMLGFGFLRVQQLSKSWLVILYL